MVTVCTLMRKDPVIVDVGTSVIEAANLMKACNVDNILIAYRAKVIGVVTESDIVSSLVSAGTVSYFLPVETIMSCQTVGIDARCSLTEAADLMSKRRILHLSLMQGSTLIGAISMRDFLKSAPMKEFQRIDLLASAH